ncbi:MAG: sulfotransferase [Microthrixaceae bacterium]
MTRLNAHGDAVGGPENLVSLDRDELIATAERSTGLSDFGGESWRPHFDVLGAALQSEAQLSVAGRLVARTELLRSLRQRLFLAEAWRNEPSILDEEIVAPVFVVGTGRSGTSILHELLALDPANRTPLTWELLHPGEAGDGSDARRVGHDVHAFWADLRPEYETMHHNHGDEPNECIFATMLEFLSDQWAGTYEIPSYSAYLVATDQVDAYRYHRKVLQTLQWNRRGERWVLKAPSHLSQLRTLFGVYPDARVVQIHRDPLRSVPSTISLMGTLRAMRGDAVDVDSLASLVSVGYAMMLENTMDARDSGALPDEQFIDVRYADLMAEPVATIESLYRSLGAVAPSGLGEAVTRHLDERPRGGRGAHAYELADTGLDEVAERSRFARYQRRHDVPDEP